jgi:ABC-2 type transport system permease protein
MTRRFRRIVLIARHDLVDLLRERGTWISLLMFPAVNVALLVLVPGMLSAREQSRQDTVRYTVAVTESSASFLLDDLRAARFDTIDVATRDEAEKAVRSRRAHVGLVLTGQAASDFAGTGQAQSEVIALTSRRSSNLAFARLIEVLEAVRSERAVDRARVAGLPVRAVRPVTAESADLADSHAGARMQLAQALPLVLILPLVASVGIAAQRISGSKDLRVMEPLLLLPLARVDVLAGKALAGLALGVVTLPAVTIPLVISRFVPAGTAGRTIALPASTIVAVTGAAAVLLVVFVAIGALAGAVARTSTELSTILPFVTFPFVLVGMSLQFLTALHASVGTALIPVLGPVLLARDVGAGVDAPGAALTVVPATVVWAGLALFFAARLLERERSVLRVTG